jgi:hypothetical protein
MRFIFGLVAGALTAMAVASAWNVPADNMLMQIRYTWQELTGSSDPHSKTPQRAAEHSMPMTPLFEHIEEFTPSTPHTEEQSSAQSPRSEAPALHTQISVDEEPAAQIQTEAPSAPMEPAETQLPETLPLSDVPGEAVVWSPFHSEASASGFANRLTRQLSHPFEVRKLGPANYVVVYAYSDANQQRSLERQIATVTGVSSS